MHRAPGLIALGAIGGSIGDSIGGSIAGSVAALARASGVIVDQTLRDDELEATARWSSPSPAAAAASSASTRCARDGPGAQTRLHEVMAAHALRSRRAGRGDRAYTRLMAADALRSRRAGRADRAYTRLLAADAPTARTTAAYP